MRPGEPGGRARRAALLPVMLLISGAVSITGCGGGDPAKTPGRAGPAAGLAVHRGAGFTVGYPKDWRPDPRRKIFRSAGFEVVAPGAGGPKAWLSVFTEAERRSTERLVAGFIARSKRSREFRLLEHRRLDAGGVAGREAYVVRKAYTSVARTGQRARLRQVDLFVRLSATSVVDVRMVFLAERYDASQPQISAVLGSFRVRS